MKIKSKELNLRRLFRIWHERMKEMKKKKRRKELGDMAERMRRGRNRNS